MMSIISRFIMWLMGCEGYIVHAWHADGNYSAHFCEDFDEAMELAKGAPGKVMVEAEFSGAVKSRIVYKAWNERKE